MMNCQIPIPDTDKFFMPETGKYLMDHYSICWDDWEVIGKYKLMGRPFNMLPFPSTIYVTDTGENISNSDPRINHAPGKFAKITGLDIHPIAIVRKINPLDKRWLNQRLKKEFAIR